MLTQYKIIKVNKYKGDKKFVNKDYYKVLPINNNTHNKINNKEIKTDNNNHSDKMNNINKYKLLNKLNKTNLKNNSNIKSKPKSNDINNNNNNYNTINVDKNINLIKNIRQNKYLIPIIEKKKNSKIFNKAKIKEAPFYISDFFSKVRQKSESNVIKSIIKKNNNIRNNRNINNNFLKNNDIDNYNNKTYSQKEINAHINNYKRIKNNNFCLTESSFDINNYIHKKSPSYTSGNNINYKEERIIYPNIYDNEMDNYNQNYYLNKIKTKRDDIRNDFNNYLQHKKLFLIYRAKLFKILYKNLYIFLNKYFILLKQYAFKILKNYYKYKNNNLLNKEKNSYTLYQKQQKSNFISNKRKKIITRINKFLNMKRNNVYDRNEDSINFSKSCANFIKNKNLSEMNERKDNFEMCRSLNYLKEKYEEIQKRKKSEKSKSNSFTNKDMTTFTDKKENIYNNNSINNLKGIYRKKRLEGFNDKSDFLFTNNKLKSTLNNLKNDFKKVKLFKKKSFGDLERKIFDYNNKNNKKEKKGEYILEKKQNVEQNSINNIKNKSYTLKKINDSKDLNKLNKYFIRKIIKNIKSSDKRLFININYAYLSNIQMKGKKEKYNKNILKIKNSIHFSIIRDNNNNKDKLGEIIEEEPSNFNYTNNSNNSNISNNSFDSKMEQNSKIINSNNINNKYLISCVNFIIKSIKRIFIRNSFKFFKKRVKKWRKKY